MNDDAQTKIKGPFSLFQDCLNLKFDFLSGFTGSKEVILVNKAN